MTVYSNIPRLLCSLSIIALLLTCFSCNDDDSGNNNPFSTDCRVDGEWAFIGTDSLLITPFTYEASGRPLGSDFVAVSYPSSQEVVVESLVNGRVNYTIGSNGYPESAYKFPVAGAPNDSSVYSYSYNGDNRITEMTITNGLEFASTLEDIRVNFTYSNGNLTNWTVAIIDPETEIFSFDYTYGNVDLPLDFNCGFFVDRQGVLNYLPGLNLYGTPISKLPISRSDGTTTRTYEYEFDENGMVSHFTVFANGNKQEEKWYTYSCN